MIAWYSRDKSSFKSLIRSLRVTAALPSPFFVMSFSYEQLLNVLNRQSFGYTGGAVSDCRLALMSLLTRIFTASGPALRASKSYHEKIRRSYARHHRSHRPYRQRRHQQTSCEWEKGKGGWPQRRSPGIVHQKRSRAVRRQCHRQECDDQSLRRGPGCVCNAPAGTNY